MLHVNLLPTTHSSTSPNLCLLALGRQRIEEHKDWMVWALILTAGVSGLVRISMYLAQPFMHCDPFLSDWPVALGSAIAVLLGWLTARARGRLGRQYRINAFHLVFSVLFGIGNLASALTFECPANRTIDPFNMTLT